MITKQIQVKFNLPVELRDFALAEAKSNGLTVSSYIRYLLVEKKEEKSGKIYRATERLEKIVAEAMKNYDKRVGMDKIFKKR
ncbi:MAG: hypothetical protein WCV93_03485 [Candidatus Shapirobacteria bacterium]|jgi:hypothetical protein